jgi:lysyl-tRNA synthetase class 2
MNMNTQISTDIIRFRHFARASIRDLFDSQGFIEVETPYLLSANTPDPFIDPIFATAVSLGEKKLQLHTSPEIWLKKALALGFERIYQMGHVFRDDPLSKSHSREFTMLEWYRVNATLTDLIVDAEAIFGKTAAAASACGLIPRITDPVFLRTDLQALFQEFARIDLSSVLRKIRLGDAHILQRTIAAQNEHISPEATFEDAFFHVMIKYIEPNLPKKTPVVIARWPLQLAALATPCQDNPDFCDRFEIYYQGLEIANAYQECADGEMLRARFIADNRERARLKKPMFSTDENFLTCLKNLPQTAGIALGIDRLFLAVLGKENIAEIIFGFGDH